MTPKVGGSLEAEQTEPARSGEGKNVLFLEDSSTADETRSCTDLFWGDGPLPANVIHIAYEHPPDELVEAWSARADRVASPRLGIIPVGEATRSAAAIGSTVSESSGAMATDTTEVVEWPVLKPVRDPDDILAIGGNLKQFLDLFSDAESPPAICFDSLTAALEHTEVETLFRFLHLVTRQIEREGARAHFHLDTAAVERSTVSTYAVLFDEVVWADGTRGGPFEPVTAAEAASAVEASPESEAATNDSNSSVDLLLRSEPWLWLIAVATFGAGDIFTSIIGIQSGLAVEASPVAAEVIGVHGLGFIYIVKIAMFGMFFLLWKVIPQPHRVGVPMGLGGLGVFITGWNLWILSMAAF